MPEIAITINKNTHEVLLRLSKQSGDNLQTLLDKAVEQYRRQLFLFQANQAFVALRKNELLWQDELNERQEWDRTLTDEIDA
ncbi:MAG: hypothetical protein WCP16_12900 [Pseudanabaena sp. ELA645]|jgi:hypothetical protein